MSARKSRIEARDPATSLPFAKTTAIPQTDVQRAIVDVEAALAAGLAAHLADTSAAHAASAIAFTPAGNIAATTVQAALAELDTEKQPLDPDLTAIAALTPTDDDVVQRKAGAWTNRTMAQIIADLAALGTTFQPLDSDLTSIAALSTTAYGRSLLTLANQAAFSALAQTAVGIHNGKITESRASNAVTFALKTLAGTDPHAGDPVIAVFPDGSRVSITSALSATIPSTATMGATNGIAFAIWKALVNDSGTIRIAVRNCRVATGIRGFPATGILSSTVLDTASDSAGVTYTDSAVTNMPFVLAAYSDYDSGLATAGTWNAGPTKTVQFGPHIPRPGSLVKPETGTTTTPAASASSTYVDTNLTATIVLDRATNIVLISGFHQQIYNGGAADTYANVKLVRDASDVVAIDGVAGFMTAAGGAITPWGFGAIDFPGASGSKVYKTQFNRAGGTGTMHIQNNGGSSYMELREIMA